MRVVMFYHSLVSDWNHGNAHFLRGIATELLQLGAEVQVFEPEGNWSTTNLLQQHGTEALERFYDAYPQLDSMTHRGMGPDIERALDKADLVLVHEWNDPELIAAIGEHHRRHGDYRLFFHDTHHRMVTEPQNMARYDLSGYDGVLAYGAVLQRLYEARGQRAWTWHEAADTRVFRSFPSARPVGDLVWIGNWGDDERAAELQEFLIEPCRRLKLKATVYGVRYPESAVRALQAAGIQYKGWLPNFEAPKVFAGYRVTVHVPRRPYVRALPGIPTIRPFEALACGIPLVCSPWDDVERLFSPGKDFLVARDGDEMTRQLEMVLSQPRLSAELSRHGVETICSRHTCGHRVNLLLEICSTTNGQPSGMKSSSAQKRSRARNKSFKSTYSPELAI
jgi:spore maturation protein CgeB